MPNVFSKFIPINDYNNSFIYRIISTAPDFEESMTYYGSTIQTLKNRMDKHRSKYINNNLNCSSKKVFDKYGKNICYIELVEKCNCEDKYELRLIEAFYIKNYPCCNDKIPSGIKADNNREWGKEYYETHKEEKKEYYESHKEDIKEYNKEYYESHTEERKEYSKEYYENHKEREKERRRLYYESHKENYKERDRIKYLNNKSKIKEQKRLYYLKKKAEKEKEKLV
jgi:hypothetical protein